MRRGIRITSTAASATKNSGRLAYRYILTQSVRHGLCANWSQYRYTHINIELERALRRALELGAFMENVPYRRYQ